MAALGAYRTLAAAGLGGALVCGGLATVDAKGVRLWKLGARVRLDWKDVRSVAAFTVSERGAQLSYLLVSTLEAPWDAPMPVSYTHLDVYKRQVPGDAGGCGRGLS